MHVILREILKKVEQGVPDSWSQFLSLRKNLVEKAEINKDKNSIEEIYNDLELAEFFIKCDLSKLPPEAYLELFSLPLLCN